MLQIEIPQREMFIPETGEFYTIDSIHLKLEHSLRSIAAWEAKWHAPFTDTQEGLTEEQLLDYIRCMTINTQKDQNVYKNLRKKDLEKIVAYMEDPMSAWKQSKKKQSKGRPGTMTAENYYFLMIHYGIPLECENWHFNRLTALIKTCEEHGRAGKPDKKMPFLSAFKNRKRSRGSGFYQNTRTVLQL